MAFVVPAEIGHAPYAGPLMDYLVANFGSVQLVAIKDKIFPRLSEDCWLLLADGAGSRASAIRLSRVERFDPRATPPPVSEDISVEAWRIRWRRRLRPFLLPPRVRNLYERMAAEPDAVRLGQVAQVGIGYVSGANGFFHLRPSDVQRFAIPDEFLVPSIRNGRYLTGAVIDDADVERWVAKDEPVLLLRIPPRAQVPGAVRAYLDTAEGQRARASYKCRNRTPWYTVPDVRRPAFVPDVHERKVSSAGRESRPVHVHRPRFWPSTSGQACSRMEASRNKGSPRRGTRPPAGSVASSKGIRSAAAC